MKRVLSFLLASLLFASAVTSCGTGSSKETEYEAETNIRETAAQKDAETVASDDPALNYDPSLITENGEARAHIVVAEGADSLLSYAAEELRYHIEKVSGAAVSVTSAEEEGSLPIVIATPDSNPELLRLFPEDLNWLSTLEEEDGRRYGSDGFCIRAFEGKIYIFGTTARGSLNGTYDFIEENMDVLWIRADEEIGLIYNEIPTITVKTDYSMGHREKSPFSIRGWIMYNDITKPTQTVMSRNKLNYNYFTKYTILDDSDAVRRSRLDDMHDVGMKAFLTGHNLKWWVEFSPAYDPEDKEYWNTSENGEHSSAKDSLQANFWSEKTIHAVSENVIDFLNQYSTEMQEGYIGIIPEDGDFGRVYPEDTEPFEYAPGQIVSPGESDYQSTVYFTFMNRVAEKVGEKYPDVKIVAYAYMWASTPPRCELEENLYITFCFYDENLTNPCLSEPEGDGAEMEYDRFLKWQDKTNNILFYNYYGTYFVAPNYERPIWNRLQNDFKYYAENGFLGVMSEGFADTEHNFPYTAFQSGAQLYDYTDQYSMGDAWAMGTLTYWLYARLAWNPNEDVDALIEEFCDKCYGEASEYMKEYYSLLRSGWDDGAEEIKDAFNVVMKWNMHPIHYWEYFIDITVEDVGLLEAMKTALENAYNAALKETEKQRIGEIRRLFGEFEAAMAE